MKTITKTILSAAVIIAAFTGCKKANDGAAGPAGATGSSGPALSGTLEGYVDLFDQYGDLALNASAVYVTCPTKTGTDSTVASGMFTKSLSTGTYELDFTKSGYGQTKIPSLNFVGGGTQYISGHIEMAQVPTFSLQTSGLTVSTTTLPANNGNAGPALTLTVTAANSDTKNRKAIVFYSTSSTVSSSPANYLGWQTVSIPVLTTGSTTGVVNIPVSAALYENGITSGSTLYLIAYPISFNSGASSYADIATGKTFFNNIFTGGATTTATVTVP